MYVFQRTLEPPRQLPGKQHIGQFALAVGQAAVVAALAVEVVESYPTKVVRQGRHHHHAGRRAALQQPDQEVRQQEVSFRDQAETRTSESTSTLTSC